MTGLMRLLAWAWASPNTLLGIVVAVVASARLHRAGRVLEAHGGGLDRLLRPWACALTLGHVILARDAGSLDHLREHELAHVRQYEWLGPSFLPVYFLLAGWIWLRGGDPYRDHPLEKHAGLGRRENVRPDR